MKVIYDILILNPDSISITNTRGKVNYNSQAVLLAGLSQRAPDLYTKQGRQNIFALLETAVPLPRRIS